MKWSKKFLTQAVVLCCLGTSFTLLPAVAAEAGGPTITGTGSSYAAVAINQWVGQMDQFFGASINYQTTSSVIGLNNYAGRQVDFGASEIGYSSNQADTVPGPDNPYQYMPTVAGATCLMFNLTSSTQQPIRSLNLTSDQIFGIFTGQIKKWSELGSSNQGVALPNTNIGVVFRTDASGENYLFSDYFSILNPAGWNAFDTFVTGTQNPGPTAIWPQYPGTPPDGARYNFGGWIGQGGSDNASNYVASSVGTITYVETAYAILHNSPCANIQNISGAFLQPSVTGDAIALTHDQIFLTPGDPRYGEQDLTGVYTAPEAAAYPISAYSYLVAPTTQISAEKGKILGEFISFLACRGQQAAGQLGYSPIPANLVQIDFDAIKRINGAAAPPPLDAAHCPNPYLTGQLSIPGGGPVIATSSGTTASDSLKAKADAAAAAAAAAAASKNTSKTKAVAGTNGIYTASGQAAGVALNTAVAGLLGSGKPFLLTLGAVLLFCGFLIFPLVISSIRKRRLAARELRDNAEINEGDVT
jgi:ABC-type phosphate transport system substrate-binding protein